MAPANPRHTQGSGEFGGRWLEGSGGVPEDILGGQFGGDGAADGVCTGGSCGTTTLTQQSFTVFCSLSTAWPTLRNAANSVRKVSKSGTV